MARIRNYQIDNMITANDRFIGTDSTTNETRSFTTQALADFVKDVVGSVLQSGSGSPNGVVTGNVGDFYIDTQTHRYLDLSYWRRYQLGICRRSQLTSSILC